MSGGIRAAVLASQLLHDAAQFFSLVGEQNPALRAQMADNADVYRLVAQTYSENPDALLSLADEDEQMPVAMVAIRLLRDAATFFLNVGDQNPEHTDRMVENAEVYRAMAQLLEADPAAEIPADA